MSSAAGQKLGETLYLGADFGNDLRVFTTDPEIVRLWIGDESGLYCRLNRQSVVDLVAELVAWLDSSSS